MQRKEGYVHHSGQLVPLRMSSTAAAPTAARRYALPSRHHGASAPASDDIACLDPGSSPIESVGGREIWWAWLSPVSRRPVIVEQPQQQGRGPKPGNSNVNASRSNR